jgi:hypothetical protein
MTKNDMKCRGVGIKWVVGWDSFRVSCPPLLYTKEDEMTLFQMFSLTLCSVTNQCDGCEECIREEQEMYKAYFNAMDSFPW